METPGGPVVLRRARTAEERQYVVNVIAKNWKRVGQVPRKHMLMWDTADGSPPADAQLEGEGALDDLPWFHKAAIGDGSPYKYFSVVRTPPGAP
jgi:hypothetical protein